MQDSIEEFLKSLSENGLSQNTIRAYRADLKKFLNFRIHSPEISMEIAAKKYLNMLRSNLWSDDPYSPKTINRKISAIRAYGRWIYKDPNFLGEYRGPKPPKSVPHPIPEGIDGVMDMLTEAPTNQHKALVALCGLAGLRVAEALSVCPADINQSFMTMTVTGKGSKWRAIPIGATAWLYIRPAYNDALEADETGTTRLVQLSDRGARKFITTVANKAGLKKDGVSSHDLRATFATAAYENTKDLRAVQELLGHASSSTTECYTGISMEAMRAAAAVI